MGLTDGLGAAAGTGIRIRRLLCKHLQHLFAGEPNGKRFRTMMDQELLRTDSNIRQVRTQTGRQEAAPALTCSRQQANCGW